jgi:excinuclease ABC subunit A
MPWYTTQKASGMGQNRWKKHSGTCPTSFKGGNGLFSFPSSDGARTSDQCRLLEEIMSRLQYLEEVGLGYLTLNRLSSTLSGGESQRIRLATQLGSNLTGSLYILDEPSIGLHPRDTSLLIMY